MRWTQGRFQVVPTWAVVAVWAVLYAVWAVASVGALAATDPPGVLEVVDAFLSAGRVLVIPPLL